MYVYSPPPPALKIRLCCMFFKLPLYLRWKLHRHATENSLAKDYKYDYSLISKELKWYSVS